MTVLINLFGASSAGKSSLMADLFTSLKQSGYTVEMCPEIVKQWAWDGVFPNKYDQYFLMGQEIKQQSRLLGKVDYVLSDSPVLQNAFYNWYIYHEDNLYTPATDYLRLIKEDQHSIINYQVLRNRPFESFGRYDTAEQSDMVAKAMTDYLHGHGLFFKRVEGEWHGRVQFVMQDLGLLCKK